MKNFFFTSESVTEGHPDKVADQISDVILDDALKQDKNSRVACEVLVGMGYAVIGGEVTTSAWLDVANLARNVIKNIGYNKPEYGFDGNSVAIFNSIHEQSPDIAMGVKKTASKEQGAGDQGMMIGFACNETPELMPLPIMLAHKLVKKLSQVRKDKILPYLRPDGKSQVTIEYENNIPRRVNSVVIAAQHDDISLEKVKEGVINEVIKPICGDYLTKDTKFFINNTGRFVIGGPASDTGMTGRKIMVDTYGAWVPVGGGAMSGKDPTKVDRSAAYMARYVAKNIVAADLAEKCLVRFSYVIGGTQPLEISVDTFGTAKIPEEKIVEIIPKVFDMSPGGIITGLDLLRPIYLKTASYGHFGRTEPEFTWERTDKIEELKKLA
ncbi:MAG: methionine adenosyltransferase [Candidatus Nealsonbacteria bacterium]|nr:methionine adenosyltransferase [Candidatus Nealsonbacteria bacterium]